MSINQGERFSNEEYLTRNQVARALGTTLIDDIWKDVLTYRQAFMTTINLRTVERNRLTIVLTPKINDRISQLDRRLYRIQVRLNELSLEPSHKEPIKYFLYRDVLKTVASAYEITFNDNIVRELLENTSSVFSPREMFLYDYYHGLNFVTRDDERGFDESLLAQVGGLFNAPPLSSYIYRTTEDKSAKQISVINNIYQHMPVNQIKDAINDFYKFMAESRLPVIVGSALILFYLDYIKPFEVHSELIAVLLAKAFLAKNELSLLAPYLNFELILAKYKDAVSDIFNETRKSYDLTYFISLLINIINESLSEIEEHLTYVATHELVSEKEVYDPPTEPTKEETPTDLFGYARVAERESRAPAPVFTPKPGAVVLPREDYNSAHITSEEANLGVGELPKTLSENDILRLERHLRESDPSLSRAEAFYFARHCTLGKYYTINDFKEVTGCAYETARTSMDHLANSGYYRKEKFKNKFIYTPTKKE